MKKMLKLQKKTVEIIKKDIENEINKIGLAEDELESVEEFQERMK